EKQLSDLETFRVATALREICNETGCVFMMNDRIDIALAAEADGVHLGQTDLPLLEARTLLGSDKLIGRSTHSLNQAREALADRASYLAVGPMFATTTKNKSPVGPGLLSDYRANLPAGTPLVAVGGITAQTALQLGAADCLAVSSAIGEAPDPAAAAAELRTAFCSNQSANTPPSMEDAS
ncbi:MAG: thiamine phosphate synthase, partial [Phycisphaerales bacterium]|nr:thiamine phosphate synthase [Phycisphaerales bacterium]